MLAALLWVVSPIPLNLAADMVGINGALQAPLQLGALGVTQATLTANSVTFETVVQSGLVSATISIEEALRGSVDLEAALQSSDGSPEV